MPKKPPIPKLTSVEDTIERKIKEKIEQLKNKK